MLKSLHFPLPLAPLLLLLVGPASAADPIPLRAGPLEMVFDAENAFLRYVKAGPHEVLRGINAPIRNQSWGTVPPKVSNLHVDKRNDGFMVTFDVDCQEKDIDFRWRGTISGSSEGVVEFTFDGEAHSTFKRNRIGFCVLHGPSAAGKPWTIESVDGKRSEGRFPALISPHQPAKNLRATEHELAPGIRARVEFEGEIFEMEDQRNWTDASFKTYCTPLEIPYPVEVAKGTKISQKIKFSVSGDLPDDQQSGAGRVVLTVGKKRSALPRIGLQVSSEIANLTSKQLMRLEALNLDHLRVDLDLSDGSFVDDLRRATKLAKALAVSLHVGLQLGDEPAFGDLADTVKKLQPRVSHWLVTGGKPDDFTKTREQLKPLSEKAKIGVTRKTNFVDLNRERPTEKTIEAVGFAINPQIHAFDNASIMETLPIHGDAVRSARQFVGDRQLIIGPITLRPQISNGGGPPAGQLPTSVDARQPAPFTAAWTLGSVKYIAETGAQSATYYETAGWKGIMDADNVGSRPGGFPSRPGKVFDVYHVLKEIGEFSGGKVQQIDSSDTLAAVALALRKPGHMRILVANLKGTPQTVALRGLGNPVAIHLLNDKVIPTRANPELPITLPPYGIARIDRVTD